MLFPGQKTTRALESTAQYSISALRMVGQLLERMISLASPFLRDLRVDLYPSTYFPLLMTKPSLLLMLSEPTFFTITKYQYIQYNFHDQFRIPFSILTISMAIVFTKKIGQQHIKQAVQLLMKEFQVHEPLTQTFARNYPHLRLTQQQRWELWTEWIQVSIAKGLGLGLFHSQTSELIGLSICKDINYDVPSIEETYSTSFTEQKCFVKLEERFFDALDQSLREQLGTQGATMQIMIVSIKQAFHGKGFSKLLISESELLAYQHNFRYCYCQASNFITAKSLEKNGFKKLFSIDLRYFEVQGQKPFYNIDEKNVEGSSWLKRLSNQLN